jgi:hypothetical protein
MAKYSPIQDLQSGKFSVQEQLDFRKCNALCPGAIYQIVKKPIISDPKHPWYDCFFTYHIRDVQLISSRPVIEATSGVKLIMFNDDENMVWSTSTVLKEFGMLDPKTFIANAKNGDMEGWFTSLEKAKHTATELNRAGKRQLEYFVTEAAKINTEYDSSLVTIQNKYGLS